MAGAVVAWQRRPLQGRGERSRGGHGEAGASMAGEGGISSGSSEIFGLTARSYLGRLCPAAP